MNPKETKWKLRVLRKLINRYKVLDRIETEGLRRKLEEAGVFNISTQWYNKGKTLDEALMLAIYTARLPEEEAKRQATEKELEIARGFSLTAPELQRRKQQEQTKEAVEKELERYTTTATSTTDASPLAIFNGEYRITHTEQKAVSVMLRLDERGEFEIYRRDGKSRQHLMTVRSGEAVSIEHSPPAESGRLEIARKEDGEFDTISLP
jgi:hypothetical protein